GDCCSVKTDDACHPQGRADWLLRVSLGIIIAALGFHAARGAVPYLSDFAAAGADLLGVMWWGSVAGMIAVGLMQRVPREYFNAILGRGDTVGGLWRAAGAGLLLDLCSHGVLMVGAKLYERGASIAQVMTFLIASPWNSFSLTIILIALV